MKYVIWHWYKPGERPIPEATEEKIAGKTRFVIEIDDLHAFVSKRVKAIQLWPPHEECPLFTIIITDTRSFGQR